MLFLCIKWSLYCIWEFLESRSLSNFAFHSCVMIQDSYVNRYLLRGICFFVLMYNIIIKYSCNCTNVSFLRDIKLRPVCHKLFINLIDIMTESVNLI